MRYLLLLVQSSIYTISSDDVCDFNMAGEIVVSAAVGVVFTEAAKVAKKGVPYLIKVFSTSACMKLRETLNGLKPTIDKMCELSREESPSPSSEAWMRSIQGFQTTLADGFRLVEECERTSRLKLHKKFRLAKKIQKLEKDIGEFIHAYILPNMALNVIKFPNYSNQLEALSQDMKNLVSRIDTQTHQIDFLGRQIIDNSAAKVEQQDSSFGVPDTPSFLVGFDKFVMELKKLVLDAHVNVVGVTGMSGMGKSTLALALCHDRQVKDHFGSKVIYITVSENPNLQDILETMWEKIVGGPKRQFQNIEEAHHQLQLKIRSIRNQPTLVVLDDVWSKTKLEKLLFEGENYKTLVTTRDESTIPKENTKIYKLPSLHKEHALSLFCHWAFDQLTIPSTHDEKLVKQVQAECNGLPLALKVIGSSLREQPLLVWESARKKLSKGGVISKYHKEDLLEHLKTSIDVLEDDEKQCFLDLAAFPQGRIISANALLDIWVNVHGMDWEDAFVILWEFAARNLLELKTDPWCQDGISYGCVYGLSFSQHNVMRDLALHLAMEDNKIHHRRLYIPTSKFQADRDQPSNAQIVSIHIGEMDGTQWSQIKFPEAQVLVLFFSASEYCIPTALDTMKNLKVLIIHNYSARRAKLNRLDGFKALSQLKVLQLEGLIVPPLHDYCKFMASLEKISLSLCVGLGNLNELGRDEFFNFPVLLEINVDHCNDLEELPTRICCLNLLKKLSVTNCHRLTKLPDELGKLGLLEVLRLCASPGLTALPPSICTLGQLKSLDISLCMRLKAYARGCSKLKNILQTLAKIASLKFVICDKENEQLFRKANCRLNVEAVEDQFNLDWLSLEDGRN